MAERVPQSVALEVMFMAYLASDHVTPATGKTIAITISKNHGALANPAAGATNATAISNGCYYVALGTGDTDTLGNLWVHGAEGTIDDVNVFYRVVAANVPVDIQTVKGQAVTCAGGVTVLANVGFAGAPGANNGATTTNGTKVNQTVDLTAGQSIACSDKTGFALSATGADLILKTSTFAQAIAAAINELATYGLTAINTLLVTTGIKAATIPAATLANGAHGGAAATITLLTPIAATVPDTQKVDVNTIKTKAVTVDAGGTTFPASVGSSVLTAANVNAEVVDALNVDTYAEPGQEAPAATNTLVKKIGYLFKAWRNKATQTVDTYRLYNDAEAVVDQKAAVSDDAVTFTKGEIATGP